jgi:hypothetical protein
MAVQLADSLGDIEKAWEARMALVEAATFGGAPEKSLVGFAWLESRSEAEPERFPLQELLWSYKWICGRAAEFPQISREQVEGTIERMRVAYESYGLSLRPYHAARAGAASMLDGDLDALRHHMKNYALAPRDRYANCRACETSYAVKIAVLLGEHEQAQRLAKPILNGRQSCEKVPHLTYGLLALPSWKMGFEDRARLDHQRGYELCRTNSDFLETVGSHLHFALVSDDEEQAIAIFKRHLTWAVDTRSAWRRLNFLAFGSALLARLKSRNSDDRFPLPDAWKMGDASSVDVTQMQRLVDAEVQQLARAMDARNLNNWVSENITANLESLA